MHRTLVLHRGLLLALAFLPALAVPVGAAVVPPGSSDQLVASGLPVLSNFDFLPDGRGLTTDWLGARIILIDPTGALPPDTVRTVPDVQFGGGEAGLLRIANVGNSSDEEIDITTGTARNVGWPLYEDPWRFDHPLCTYPDTLTLTAPSFWYPHPSDGWATGFDYPTRMRFGPDGALVSYARPGLKAFSMPAVNQVHLGQRLPTAGPATLLVTAARGRRVHTLVQDSAAHRDVAARDAQLARSPVYPRASARTRDASPLAASSSRGAVRPRPAPVRGMCRKITRARVRRARCRAT